MLSYILRRLLMAPLVVLVLVTISFVIIRAAPGGPFSGERRMDPVVEEALRAKYHLDEPLAMQYVRWLGDLCRGDLGPSYKQKTRTVNEIIADTLPTSLFLGALSLLLALFVGLIAGILGAVRQDRAWDHATMLLAMVGLSIPTFVIGPMLVLVFAMHLGWLPVAEYKGPWHPSYLILPAVTLAIPFAARIARLSRAGMLDVINADFIRTARAKGSPEMGVILRHALPSAMIPVVGFLGPAVAALLTGSLVIEKIFQIPGLGREFVESATNRDYTLVMGTVIVYGLIVLLCNLLADLLLGVIDPRIRYE
ncbi:MAG: ABC transporter permease [Planctomycetes bacterium]|nr:ABC transporter permease [Planctomycetota bacterium]